MGVTDSPPARPFRTRPVHGSRPAAHQRPTDPHRRGGARPARPPRDPLAAEHQLLVQRAHALDNSVGLTLGFATALAALADPGNSPLARLAVVPAACSAPVSMTALGAQSILAMSFTTRYDEIELLSRRDLVEFDLRRHARVERYVERRQRLFRLASRLLVAALVAGAGGIVGGGGGSGA